MIATDAELARLLPELEKAAVLSVDTEADSLHAYPEKVCLIQITHPEGDVLVDPLAQIDLAPLWDTLKTRELILHGADYDLRMLHRGHGFIPKKIFDTMTAARLLGFEQFGLNNLVQNELGVTLEKGPQKMNWARRPLTERMVTYARNDTHYLPALRARLETALREAGRYAWQEQVCDRLIQDCTQPVSVDHDEVWRVKGSDRLNCKALSVLRTLWHWREQEARAFNTPPFFVLAHENLLGLAIDAAQDPAGNHVGKIRTTPRRRQGVIQAIKEGLSTPSAEQPQPRRPVRHYPSPGERQRFIKIKAIRDAKATELKLDPSLIASKGLLVALSQDWKKGLAELMPWQRELLAEGDGHFR